MDKIGCILTILPLNGQMGLMGFKGKMVILQNVYLRDLNPLAPIISHKSNFEERRRVRPRESKEKGKERPAKQGGFPDDPLVRSSRFLRIREPLIVPHGRHLFDFQFT